MKVEEPEHMGAEALKIMLINPRLAHFPGRAAKSAAYGEPPLGIAYLSSYLKAYCDRPVEVKLIDATIENLSEPEVAARVLEYGPALVGATCATPMVPAVKNVLARVRAANPAVITAAGGPHPTVRPGDLFPEADFCLLGEGEESLARLVDRIEDRTGWDSIPGIWTRERDPALGPPERRYIPDIDLIPYPDRDGLPLDLYAYVNFGVPGARGRYATLITARGCPFRCRFCGHWLQWGRQVRLRSVDNIMGELHQLADRYQISFLTFYDDTFTINHDRVREICGRIIDEGLGFYWSCFIRAGSVDEELLRRMYAAGCREVQVGVESGDQGVLDQIDKDTEIGGVEETFAMIRRVGLQSRAFFIIGHPTETRESALSTIRFADRLDPDLASFMIFVPFPGLEVHDEFKAEGRLVSEDWGDYNWYSRPVYDLPELTGDEVLELRRRAETRFYLKPARVLKYLYRAVRGGRLKVLFRNFFAWLNIVSERPGH